MWPFSETNAAAMRILATALMAGLKRCRHCTPLIYPGNVSVIFDSRQRTRRLDKRAVNDAKARPLYFSEIVTMPQSDFEAEILEDEVVIAHAGEGHVYHFPILSNGTVSLHGRASRRIRRPSAKPGDISSMLTMPPEQRLADRRRDAGRRSSARNRGRFC
jgi:hypothetical protein